MDDDEKEILHFLKNWLSGLDYKDAETVLDMDWSKLMKGNVKEMHDCLDRTRDELKEHGLEQWQGIKPLKNEMDEFLQGDVELNTMKVRLEYLETMIYLLESILGQLKARDWQIKSAIEWKRFLAGM